MQKCEIMKKTKLFLFLGLFILLSLSQACVSSNESIDQNRIRENTPQRAKTNTATEICITKTLQFTGASTNLENRNTDVNREGKWGVVNEKSTAIATSLRLSVSTISSATEVDKNTALIPTKSSPVTIITPKPTETQQPPAPTAFAGCPNGCTFHPPGCEIKGNISISTGEKIYHVPGGEFYDECVINPDYGERWFCTEQEAIDNGWRKSKY